MTSWSLVSIKDKSLAERIRQVKQAREMRRVGKAMVRSWGRKMPVARSWLMREGI